MRVHGVEHDYPERAKIKRLNKLRYSLALKPRQILGSKVRV